MGGCAALLIAIGPFGSPPADAQSTGARVLITAQPDEQQLVRLSGNTRPEAIARNDRGRVPDTLLLEHMLLLLKRPAEREAALKVYVEQLHDRRSPNCVFYDVTLGDMDVDCQGSNGCYLPSGTYGVLSASAGAFQPAYGAASGWDFATGIGTINAGNLLAYWNSADLVLTGSGNVTSNGLLSYALQVSNTGPQTASGAAVTATLPSGFTLVAGSSSAGCAQSGQTLSCTVGTLADGKSALLTIVIQPGPGSTANLGFAAVSGNPDLDAGAATMAIALNLPSQTGQSADGPLPVWANALLAVVLMAVARGNLRRQRRASAELG